jgi:hypothetical protein
MWEPRRLTTVWAFMACYRDGFTFTCFMILGAIYWQKCPTKWLTLRQSFWLWQFCATMLSKCSSLIVCRGFKFSVEGLRNLSWWRLQASEYEASMLTTTPMVLFILQEYSASCVLLPDQANCQWEGREGDEHYFSVTSFADCRTCWAVRHPVWEGLCNWL